jgi:hypothetical protein
MKASFVVLSVAGALALAGFAGCDGNDGKAMSFFVTSDTSATGNLGGLRAADARCQRLAAAVGRGDSTWRAYLSAEVDPDNGNRPADARDRIGRGPWYNRNGELVAKNRDDLQARAGDADIFIDELGRKVNGQWPGSPLPVQHDILTGSTADGKVMPGLTCDDWTSAAPEKQAQVGHSDGLGVGGSSVPPANSWNSVHASGSCADTSLRGGAGKIYCFAAD